MCYEKKFDFMDNDRKNFLKIKHEQSKRFINPEIGKVYAHMVERIISSNLCEILEEYIDKNTLGYKLITIGRKI